MHNIRNALEFLRPRANLLFHRLVVVPVVVGDGIEKRVLLGILLGVPESVLVVEHGILDFAGFSHRRDNCLARGGHLLVVPEVPVRPVHTELEDDPGKNQKEKQGKSAQGKGNSPCVFHDDIAIDCYRDFHISSNIIIV